MSKRPSDDASTLVSVQGEPFRVLYDAETIRSRVREIGREIDRDYAGKNPILIGVLNGAFIFLADLIRTLEIACEVDFMKLSSYGASKVSSGDVKQLKAVDADIEGRHVVVVEDIVDTGHSMEYILGLLGGLGPASLRVATLLHKVEATERPVQLDYVGFCIPNRFVIGYGLDYAQKGRNLQAIYIRAEETEA